VAIKGQENLIPMNERTKEEQKKIATMGGIRSGEVRREKATMKATLEMLLNETNKNGKTYRELATLGLLKGAINGNAQNYKTIVEMLGELLQPEESKARITIVNSLPKDDEDESNN
jgi:hypothetical protein